jgi:hypothetical protein
MGQRTLELSEVRGAHADQYRPRDGGQNMRQYIDNTYGSIINYIYIYIYSDNVHNE